MPRISAEALASADVMDIARQTAHVHHNLFESNHLRTDFVMVSCMPWCARPWNVSKKQLPIILPSGRFLTRALYPGTPTIGENKMLKRIASTGVNLVVLGVSVAIFLVAFFALNALAPLSDRPRSRSCLPRMISTSRCHHFHRPGGQDGLQG